MPPSFKPGAPWHDTAGNLIDAHGAGLLHAENRYWWYGSKRHGHACKDWSAIPRSERRGHQCTSGGVNAYSSETLYEWRFEGTVVPAFNSSDNGRDLERPKVIRCPSTGKFVMWVRGTGPRNNPQLLAVFTSDAPAGPYSPVRRSSGEIFHHVSPQRYMYADATLFQDPVSGRAFVYFRTQVFARRAAQNTGFHAMELTRDCTGVRPQTDTRLFQSPFREAPAVFHHAGRYHLWLSGCNGWQPTAMYLYAADHPLGPFNVTQLDRPMPNPGETGNVAPQQPGKWAFDSQSTFILPNPQYRPGSGRAQFVYLGDRWDTQHVDFGRYVWLPLFVDPRNSSRVRVTWHDEWRLDESLSPFEDASASVVEPTTAGTCPRAGTREEVRRAVAHGALPRVIGAGLPHTGTTTLNTMLVEFGCCLSTDNTKQINKSHAWIWDMPRRPPRCAQREGACLEAMRSEFERFQCVTDDPWAVRWRELLQWHRADDGFRDVGKGVVVIATLAKSPIDYAITRLLFERRYFALRQANESAVEARLRQLVHYYTAHEEALRAAAAAGRAPVHFVCWACGDTYGTLKRALGLALTEGDEGRAAPRANAAPAWQKAQKEVLRARYSHLQPGGSEPCKNIACWPRRQWR